MRTEWYVQNNHLPCWTKRCVQTYVYITIGENVMSEYNICCTPMINGSTDNNESYCCSMMRIVCNLVNNINDKEIPGYIFPFINVLSLV